ncbi:MAG: choice-of-anchor Q domain-containing protein [Solirubrobacteraceae bacterium]
MTVVALAGAAALAVTAAVGVPPAAADTTIKLTTSLDETTSNNGCSLREALMYANGSPAAECATTPLAGTTTIVAPAGCYRLTMGQLVSNPLRGPVVLQGAGPGPAACNGSGTVIDAQHSSRVLDVNSTASVSGLTLTGGVADAGGGIRTGTGSILTLTNVAVTGNAAAPGIDATTDGGQGFPGGVGGGILTGLGATLNVVNSTITDNAGGVGGQGAEGAAGGAGGSGGPGGGIYNETSAHLTVTGSTISGNSAGAGGDGSVSDTPTVGGAGGQGGSGGGIVNAGTLVITNSTISGNSAGAGGRGGLGFPSGGPGVAGTGGGIDDVGGASLANVTVAGNTAHGNGDGIDDTGTLVQPVETDSVIAGNGVQNCAGPLIKDGGSNVAFPAEPFSNCPGTTADPRLGPLQGNGGPTATMALLPGSAAIGLVPLAGCVSADQRGVARPQGSACDAGAFEWAPPVIGAASASATGQTTAVVKATITNPDLQDAHVAVSYGTATSYGSTTAQQDLGTSAAAVSANVPLSGLQPGTLYHVQVVVTNADGTSRSSDMTAVTASSAVRTPAPTVTGFHQSASRWIEGSALSRASAKRKRPPVGTTFTFRLNETATYVLAFTRTVTGRKVKGHCVAQTRRNRRNRTCPRGVPAGSLRHGGHAGINKVAFQGRLTRTDRLRPGRYTVAIVATGSQGQRTRPQQLSFTIDPR